MDEFEKKAMQELHIKIMHCLEPSQLHDYLFQEDIIPEDFLFKLRQQCRIPTEISRLFIMHLKKHCPFHVFLIALRQDNAYSFLAKELEGKLEEIKSQRRNRSSSTKLPWYEKAYHPIRRIQVYNEYREDIVHERHLLKRLCLDSKLPEFYSKQRSLKLKWEENRNIERCDQSGKQLAADLYFISLDAEMEHRRVKYDKSLYESDVFKEMKAIIKETSNPKLSMMLYLGRLASSMVMFNNNLLKKGLKAAQEARENGERIEPCRETGIVLLIYYNLLCQEYEITRDQSLRDNLITIASESLDHFAQERDEVCFDFRRIVMLKASFIYLGIGLFCDILSAPVSESHIKYGKNCLEKALLGWERMERRWKMIFHFAFARIHQIHKRWDLAYSSVEDSYRFCNDGNFYQEKTNILIFREFIKKNYDLMNT